MKEGKRSKGRTEVQAGGCGSGEMAEEGHRHHADVVLQPTEVENITEGRGLKQIQPNSLTCSTAFREHMTKSRKDRGTKHRAFLGQFQSKCSANFNQNSRITRENVNECAFPFTAVIKMLGVECIIIKYIK